MPDYSLLTHRGNFNPWDVYAIMQARTDNMQARYDEYMDALEELGKDWAQWDARVNPETEGKTREIYEGVMNGIRNEADRLAQHGLDFGMRRRLMDHRLDSTKAMTRISDAWTNRAAMLTDYQKKRDADASWMPERDLSLPENYSLDNWLDKPLYDWGRSISANAVATQVGTQITKMANQISSASLSGGAGASMFKTQYGLTPEEAAIRINAFLDNPGEYLANASDNDYIAATIRDTLQGNGVDIDGENRWLTDEQLDRMYGQIASTFPGGIGNNTITPIGSGGSGGGGGRSGGGKNGGDDEDEEPLVYRKSIYHAVPNSGKEGPNFVGELANAGIVRTGRFNDGKIDFDKLAKSENNELRRRLFEKIGYNGANFVGDSDRQKEIQKLYDKYVNTQGANVHPDFATGYRATGYTLQVRNAGNAWDTQLQGGSLYEPMFGASGIKVGDKAKGEGTNAKGDTVNILDGRTLVNIQAIPNGWDSENNRRDIVLLTNSTKYGESKPYILNETGLNSSLISDLRQDASKAEDYAEILQRNKVPEDTSYGYAHDPNNGSIIFRDEELSESASNTIEKKYNELKTHMQQLVQRIFREAPIGGKN